MVFALRTCVVVLICLWPATSNIYAADNLIVSIKAHGGLCPYGECSAQQEIFKDGIYKLIDGTGHEKKASIDQGDTRRLVDLIEKTDFQQIKSHPFKEICPTAYDGQEVLYSFYTSHGVEEIGSCQYQIDENDPLFKELSNILINLNREQ